MIFKKISFCVVLFFSSIGWASFDFFKSDYLEEKSEKSLGNETTKIQDKIDKTVSEILMLKNEQNLINLDIKKIDSLSEKMMSDFSKERVISQFKGDFLSTWSLKEVIKTITEKISSTFNLKKNKLKQLNALKYEKEKLKKILDTNYNHFFSDIKNKVGGSLDANEKKKVENFLNASSFKKLNLDQKSLEKLNDELKFIWEGSVESIGDVVVGKAKEKYYVFKKDLELDDLEGPAPDSKSFDKSIFGKKIQGWLVSEED